MFGADPILQGYAASLGRPGGNITGVTILSSQLDGKRLEMLREAVPSAKRIAALLPPTSSRDATAKVLRETAAAGGIELLTFDAPTPADYAAAFKAMQGAKAEALILSATAQFYRDRAQLLALAREARLPVVCEWPDMARLGCSIGYGPSQQELRRRVADFVGKIFQGAAPSALPIEAPNRFELAINLKATRSLGIEVPQSLLLRADEVIE
jgi:putative tryptophan/tyrosine transport system substrate-binding protein